SNLIDTVGNASPPAARIAGRDRINKTSGFMASKGIGGRFCIVTSPRVSFRTIFLMQFFRERCLLEPRVGPYGVIAVDSVASVGGAQTDAVGAGDWYIDLLRLAEAEEPAFECGLPFALAIQLDDKRCRAVV